MRLAPGRLSAVLIAMISLAPAGHAQQPEQSSRPTFRGGVDVVQLDVTVLDKNRHPLRGLTAPDFTVLEDGKPRPVVGIELVDLPRPEAPYATWTRDVAPDVVSNQQFTGRIITIVMDDANSGHNGDYWDPWVGQTGKRIARDVIQGLGPADAAAVTFTFVGSKQNFTPDRARLLKALDSFVPRDSPTAGPPMGCTFRGRSGCVLDTLDHVADAVPVSPPRRKVIVLISGGTLPLAELDQTGAEQRTSHEAGLDDLQRVFRKLQQANVSIYAFSPQGLQVGGPAASKSDRLRMFAEQTGGRTVMGTNVPWEGVPAMFEETQSYYLVAFESARSDGAAHRVDVRVNRPDATVRSRSMFVAAPDEKTAKKRPKAPKAIPPADAAMESGFPLNALPLETTMAAFAEPGRREAVVLIWSRIAPGATASEARPVAYRATAFDRDWHDRATDRQTVAMRAKVDDARGTVASVLHLEPGRYELRVAAESGGRAGSLFTDLEIADLDRLHFSVSGLLAGPRRSPAELSGVPAVPVNPTVSRVFRPGDDAAAFVRVYQRGQRTLLPVDVRVTVEDNGGIRPVDEMRTLTPDQFVAGSADVDYLLPLGRLGTGEHLLTIALTCGKQETTRTMRFVVEKP